MKKNPTQKSLKIKSFFGFPSCLKNKRVVVLNHNSTTAYPIDTKFVAPRALFILTFSIKNGTTIKQKLHSRSHDQTLKFTSRTNLDL
jgi:hypothetical protein